VSVAGCEVGGMGCNRMECGQDEKKCWSAWPHVHSVVSSEEVNVRDCLWL
jgi:hypothetical protein